MGADSVLEELLNSWKAFWIYLSWPVKARTATVHLGLEDNFHGVKYSFNSFLPETTSWCFREAANSAVRRPPLWAKEWPGMTLKSHLWMVSESHRGLGASGEKAIPGLEPRSQAGHGHRRWLQIKFFLKCFSCNFLDIKHREGFGEKSLKFFEQMPHFLSVLILARNPCWRFSVVWLYIPCKNHKQHLNVDVWGERRKLVRSRKLWDPA